MIQKPKFLLMSKSHMTKIMATAVAVISLGGVAFNLSIPAQAGATENFGLADWSFTPVQGGTAPLFRSADDTTIKLLNLKTDDVVVPADAQFTCKIEARAFQPKSATAAWTTVGAASIPYTVANGCSAVFTKAQRGNGLNWAVRVTVTSTTDSTKTYEFNNTYAYRFQGAGVASGG
jgi:hypothetical protein